MIKRWVFALVFALTIGGTAFTAIAPNVVQAKECASSFLGFPAWYRGLTDGKCNIEVPSSADGGISNFIWHVVLNILDMALVLIGYVAVGYIIYGGFKYIISRGSPDSTAKALSTILEAIIGLVISIIAIVFVNFIIDGVLK